MMIFDIAKKVARQVARQFRYDDHEELEQEALVAMLVAKKRNNFDAQVGVSMERYMRGVAAGACKNFVFKARAPVSAHRYLGERLGGLRTLELKHDPVALADSPDELLHDHHRQVRVKQRIMQVMQSTEGCLLAMPVLLEGKKSACVAEERGVDVEDVYRATNQARRALRNDLELYQLHRED